MRPVAASVRRVPRSLAATVAVVAIALFALNLRPAVVAVGPLSSQLRGDTGLSASAVGLLTTLPLVCFGLFSIGAPALGRRFGLERTLAFALLLLVGGVLLRLIPVLPALFGGAAVAGAGIAIGNVLLPAAIKRDFPDRTGPLMAVYAVALNGGAALAAAVTVPLQHAVGVSWRGGLALWLVPALAAVVTWVPVLRAGRGRAPDAGPAERVAGTWRSPVAWALALFMGLQSLEFYAMAAWLPTILQDHGVSEAAAGVLLSLMSVAAIAVSVVVPVRAARTTHQRDVVAVAVVLFVLGTAGLLLAPAQGALAWVLLLGAAQGTALSLSITMFALRTRSAAAAGELSGMAQAVGYLVAATGPTGIGALHDLSGGWTVPLAVLAALLVPLALAGRSAAADRVVTASRPA